jgi:RNA polymerase sigma-70 factor, ECF subfamily
VSRCSHESLKEETEWNPLKPIVPTSLPSLPHARADGSGKVKQAALRPIRGRDAVTRFSLGTKRFWPENYRIEPGEVNGQADLIIRAGEKTFAVFTIDVEQGQIQAIRIIANPDKHARI